MENKSLTVSEKKSHYRKIITPMLNKQIKVVYKRKSANKKDERSIDIIHTLHGKVLKIRKHSFLLRLNNPYTENKVVKYKNVSIGYRNLVKEPILLIKI